MEDTKRNLFLIFFDKMVLGLLVTVFLLAGQFYVSRKIAEDFRRLEKIEDLHVAIDECDHVIGALGSYLEDNDERREQLKKVAYSGRECHGALLKAALYMRNQGEQIGETAEICHKFSETVKEVQKGHEEITSIGERWAARYNRKLWMTD